VFCLAISTGKYWIGAQMKIAVAILLFTAVFGLAAEQQSPSTQSRPAPSIGLEIGQQAPAFALPDEFGREQTNQTLKGANGTVMVFFRSADW
jgi:cytochrome oxidase Cu insertion factor (SCO1/SenC/PrrC family)